jgi:hypothetical protein
LSYRNATLQIPIVTQSKHSLQIQFGRPKTDYVVKNSNY